MQKMAAALFVEQKEEELVSGDLTVRFTHVDQPITPGPMSSAKAWEAPGTNAATHENQKEQNATSTSAYTLASDQSLYGGPMDTWLRSGVAPVENIGVQHPRMLFTQRPNVAPTTSLDPTGWWYLIAMILPLFSMNNGVQWGWCTQETVMNAGEILLTQISSFCQEARAAILRLAQEQLARDFFATAMDIILIVYAIGFLFLSLYQACFFG